MQEISKTLEQEIADMERTLAAKKAALEGNGKEGVSEKEILHQAIAEKIAATPPSTPPSSQPSSQSTTTQPSYLSAELHAKVQQLVQTVFNQSLEQGIALAKATQNPALIDAFHDVIVDELYKHLVETGKLEPVK